MESSKSTRKLNCFILLASIGAVIVNGVCSYTKITSFVPLTFILLFIFQKNKKQELLQLFSMKNWKRPFLYIIICILFTFLYIYQNASQLPPLLLISFIYWLLIQAFNEEYVFRYLFLTKLQGSTKSKVIISSVLFTLVHYIFPEELTSISIFFWTTMLFRFMIGLILCYFYLHHHFIYEITIMHCLSNIFNFFNIHRMFDYFILLVFFILFENRTWFFDRIKKIKNIAS